MQSKTKKGYREEQGIVTIVTRRVLQSRVRVPGNRGGHGCGLRWYKYKYCGVCGWYKPERKEKNGAIGANSTRVGEIGS